MAMRPIHRIKHVVDSSAVLASGTQLPIPLVTTKDAPVLANVTEVETGAKVNGVYLRVEVIANENIALGVIGNCYLAIVKNVGGNLTFPNANAVGSSDNKRFVIHQEMLMLNGVGQGNPRVLFNGVIAIPKGYRRFGPNDTLDVLILAPLLNIMLCVQCHYKEFR